MSDARRLSRNRSCGIIVESKLADDLTVASSVYSRAVRKAAELLGGRDNLARILNVPVADVNKWIAGEKPPREIFLRVVDLIIDETAAPGDSAENDDAAPRDCAPAGSPMHGGD